MKDSLKNVVLAATGDFGKDRSTQKIRQWVEHQGGTYTTKIGPEVTHLVASKDHYKRSAKMGMCFVLVFICLSKNLVNWAITSSRASSEDQIS